MLKRIILATSLIVVVMSMVLFAYADSDMESGKVPETTVDRLWSCPNCSAILNEQEGFSTDLTYWECKYCHTPLEFSQDDMYDFDPETAFEGARFPGWYWYCDNCEAFLNVQKGFDDHLDTWTCTECGHENPITDSETYETPEAFLSSMGRAYTEDWYNFYITPHIYESDANFSFSNTGEKANMTFGDYSLGKLFAYGEVYASTSYKKCAAFDIDSLDFSFGYEYSGKLLDKSDTDWCLVSCKDKSVDGIKLEKEIGYGCMIVQTSSDGVDYRTVDSIPNLFSDYPSGIKDVYQLMPEEVLSGTFFKVIIAYQTHKKTGESNVLFVHNDNYDNRYHVEIYDFYVGFDNPSVGLYSMVVKENNLGVVPKIYENTKEFLYEGIVESNKMAFGQKSLGNYSIGGQFTNVNTQSDVSEIKSASKEIVFSYSYNGLLDVEDSVWTITDDSAKKVGDIDIGGKVGKGAVIFQHSLDGQTWVVDHVITDAFKDATNDCSYHCYIGEDAERGAYYRTIIAYQTKRKTDTSKILFISKDNYEYLKQVEVYTSYIALDEKLQSSDIWDSDEALHICGFQIDKMGTRYDVSVNGAMADDGQKYVTNGDYTIVVTTPLGKMDSRTITVDNGYDSLGEMLEDTDDISSLIGEPVIQVHHFDAVNPVNTGKDNGFAKADLIQTNDPHFGWALGHFTISGFSYKEMGPNGEWTFYRVRGDSGEEYDDNIVLQFDLKQNIDELDGDTSKRISSDTDRKDQIFQYQGNPFGRGSLLVRHEKADGQVVETKQYSDYLDAKGEVNVNTEIEINEEGLYQIALDYEVESRGTLNSKVYSDYRIALNFRVLNGNCAVYAFDLDSGMELENGGATESGFKLDLAESKNLMVTVKRDRIVEGVGGLTLNTSFNGLAKDGMPYTEPGLYTITAVIPSTGHQTEKVIYVGDLEEYEEYLDIVDNTDEEEEE